MTAYHRVLSVYTVVQKCALADYYCCFHLTSGTSTAVGPYIVDRNREGFLLSQSTLREECVEKKYQVFDTIGLLTILVQVPGVDCGSTFAPVCRLQSIRMVLAIAAKFDFEG